MVDSRTQANRPIGRIGDRGTWRTRAREEFKASVRQMVAEKRPLGDLGDIEATEAATEITRRR